MGMFKNISIDPNAPPPAPKEAPKKHVVAGGYGKPLEVLREFKFDSSKRVKNKYTVLLYRGGLVSCNCQGWCVAKKDMNGDVLPRECTHTKQVEVKLGEKFESWTRYVSPDDSRNTFKTMRNGTYPTGKTKSLT